MSYRRTALVVVVCAALVLDASADSLEDGWNDFKQLFRRTFKNLEDENVRHELYKRVSERIERFNSERAEELGFTLGLNNFSDWTEEELRSLTGLRAPADEASDGPQSPDPRSALGSRSGRAAESGLPEALDWRETEGRVTPIKDQGQCGSCWAYVVTGALEGQQGPQNVSGALVPLSEQNMVDCSKSNGGCQGGWPTDAFSDMRDLGGFMAERDYPYEAREGQCRHQRPKTVMNVSGSHMLPSRDEQALKQAVARIGPMAVAVNANRNFQNYRSGVFNDPFCSGSRRAANHAVLVVGYGTDARRGDYWLIKNSWGTSWGERGYMRLARNRRNMCGVATSVFVPEF